ncbi:MAG: PEP-CTERM sorting domain-containing protein [Spartobacteria bacterium]|nr:PEP-CTERM sorting domain-containing protein [Spartobacteria bacterium]
MRTIFKWITIFLIMISQLCVADMVIDMTTIGNAGNPAYLYYEGVPQWSWDDIWMGGVDYTYQIGTYEVTVAQYTEFLNAAAQSDPYGMYNPSMGGGFAVGGALIQRSGESGSYTYTAESGKENQPVRGVTFYSSARFANWLNNGQGSANTETGAYNMVLAAPWLAREAGAKWAVTSEDEWFKAAYYDPDTQTYYKYPNSSDETPEEPTDGTTTREMNFGLDPTWHGDGVTFTSTGETTGHSPYGIYDMGGNVQEWTDTIYSDERYYHGGSFMDDAFYLSTECRFTRDPSVGGVATGFRVVHIIPEPGSILLLIIGGLLLWCRRKLH